MPYIADPGLDPAFPPQGSPNKQGITVRDYFAAAALAGICGANQNSEQASLVASKAYAFADAMLLARAEKK
jgi:hypothetical protein